MNIAIRYYTRSKKGNTKKLAGAVSSAVGLPAADVSQDLDEKVDRLFLINAMYGADIDTEVKEFLRRNSGKIGEIVNFSTSAIGSSTVNAVKKVADSLGIRLSEKEFHCRASWLLLNKGLPSDEDLRRAGEFALSQCE